MGFWWYCQEALRDLVPQGGGASDADTEAPGRLAWLASDTGPWDKGRLVPYVHRCLRGIDVVATGRETCCRTEEESAGYSRNPAEIT